MALKVFEDSDRCVGERRRLRTAGLAMTAAWVRGNNSFIEWIRPDAGAFCCIRLKPHLYDDAAVGRFHAALAERGVRVALRLVTEALKQTSRAAA